MENKYIFIAVLFKENKNIYIKSKIKRVDIIPLQNNTSKTFNSVDQIHIIYHLIWNLPKP